MKKIWMIFAACLLMLTLAACGKKDQAVKEDNTKGNEVVENEADTDTDMDGTDTTEGTGDTGGVGNTTDENTVGTEPERQNVENADAIADAVSELEEVDHANVLKMNDGAYVGATLKEDQDSTKELEEKIADKAKEAGAGIDKVYVSTNPDFTKQIDDYSDKVRDDKPAEGLFEEISDSLKRMFPDAH